MTSEGQITGQHLGCHPDLEHSGLAEERPIERPSLFHLNWFRF